MPRSLDLSSPRVWTVVLVLFAMLPALGLTLYSGVEQRRSAAARLEADALRLARLAAGSQRRLVESAHELLVALAAFPEVRRGDAIACGTIFAQLRRRYPHYANLGAVRPDGTVFCSAVPLGGRAGLSAPGYAREASETRDFPSVRYQVDPASGRAAVTFASPVLGEAGHVQAVVFAALDVTWLNQVASEVPLPDKAMLMMVDAGGTIVASAPEPGRWVGLSMRHAPIVQTMLTRTEGAAEATGLDGLPRLHVFTDIGDGLFLSVGVSRDVALAEANRLLVRNLGALGVLAALAVGLAWIGGRRLSTTAVQMKAEQQARQALVNEMSDLVARRAREVGLFNQMSGLLQTCVTVPEAAAVIGRLMGQFFADQAGALFVTDPARNAVERVALWGEPLPGGRPVFAPDECWALRRGQPYGVEDTASGLLCLHLGEPLPPAYLCVPLVAQGAALGVLHLASGLSPGPEAPALLVEAKRRLAVAVAEQLALSLANLRLREELRAQSIRDPLTGLFNRRYMEETLERELRRAEREQRPIGVLMLDVDDFRRFNDTFGHEAGDAVLSALGAMLRAHVRGGDIPCRYGGEEFVLILPGATAAEAGRRAGTLREVARDLRVSHRGLVLGPVTLSMGAAAYPEHGQSGDVLLRAADAALYRAKDAGRDRVVVAD